jgi:serine/threonine protein kinase/Tol biopolymer transport system component
MSIEPGTRLGPYEVLASIGGGPEERYKASDTRLNRVVTLKVLPAEFSENPEMKARLERDTRTISSLNHPQICTLVDVGHQDPSTDFLVTEYLEGETLAEQLARGPMAVDEALKLAIAIADVLDKAHRQAIIHGGLNPSVVILTARGPKLLDFGLAKLQAENSPVVATSMATTRTSISSLSAVPTFAAPYMAPEQFAGLGVDARTDIFAVGAILYEMVAGRPAFQEKTQALLVAAVQTVEPDPVSKAQPMAPPALDHVIRRCLNKDPRQRLQTAWDLMSQLQWIAEGGSQIGIPAPVAARRQRRDWAVWSGVAAASLLAVGLTPAAVSSFRASPEPELVRFTVSNMGAGQVPLSISPNGRWITNSRGGTNRGVDGLVFGSIVPQVLIEDSIITQPFWSPDSRFIAFFQDGKLKKGDISGGPSQIVCDTPTPIGGGTWNSEGVMLFSGAGVIHRVLAAGGQPTAITELDQSGKETEHLAPFFLPDGRHYLFLVLSADSGIYVGSIDSRERKRLLAAESRPLYAAPGYLLFNRAGTVFAQPFDAETLELSGESVRVADGVPTWVQGTGVSPSLTRTASYAVSQAGVLAYRTGGTTTNSTGGADEQRSLYWVDRRGQRSSQVGTSGMYVGVDLSPDGKRFAVHRHEGTGGDSWSFDLAQGRMQRLTFDTTQDNSSPVWSPDGTRIAFASVRANKWGLYVKSADGTGAEELIVESEAPKAPMSWSPDGKVLVYWQLGGAGDVWTVPLTGEKKAVPMMQSQFAEVFAQVSPDGKWLAYQSNETGRAEIYVRPFPEGPGKWQVSTDGGQFPRWRRDGKELYFLLAPDIWAADIRVTGSALEAGVPQSLFTLGGNPTAAATHVQYHRFAVTADGQRFLLSAPSGGATTSGGLADAVAAAADGGGSQLVGISPNGVTVVVNWPQMLKNK